MIGIKSKRLTDANGFPKLVLLLNLVPLRPLVFRCIARMDVCCAKLCLTSNKTTILWEMSSDGGTHHLEGATDRFASFFRCQRGEHTGFSSVHPNAKAKMSCPSRRFRTSFLKRKIFQLLFTMSDNKWSVGAFMHVFNIAYKPKASIHVNTQVHTRTNPKIIQLY